MSKVINLRSARKRAQLAARRVIADENAVRHGESKAERRRREAECAKARAHLDGHRRDDRD